MKHVRRGGRFSWQLAFAAVAVVLTMRSSSAGPIRPSLAALASAPPELVARLRADPFVYFRFVNREWAARVCEAFADVSELPIVQLHGDAHVEQFAVTKDAWGLNDFDDSARGPEYIDIVRFLGSIDLAVRQRGWTHDRDALWDRFYAGYRTGILNPNERPPQPDIVRMLRSKGLMSRAAFLAWGERQMKPMDAAASRMLVTGMEALERLVRAERPDIPAGYFAVKRAGWLRIGVGSSKVRKVLIRIQGRTADAADDELLEAKETTNLAGVSCLAGPTTPPALRVIDGTRQLSRVKHDILAIGPTMVLPAGHGRGEHWLDWWVATWEPSYREVSVSELRSVTDLGDIAYDAGVQLGGGVPGELAMRTQALSSLISLKDRIRKETSIIVDEMLADWKDLRKR